MARLDQLVERARARRDDAHVDALADRSADHLHFARIQEFDQLGLRFQWNALDMVDDDAAAVEIGRAHVRTPVTNAQLDCRLLLEKKKYNQRRISINIYIMILL